MAERQRGFYDHIETIDFADPLNLTSASIPEKIKCLSSELERKQARAVDAYLKT